MSVLNFPRIYLNGHMFWNPPTANNNDMLPVYEAVNMDINWPFMQYYGITPQNAPTQLMPWFIKPVLKVPDYVAQVPTNASPPFIPAEWDLFGDNACGTVNYTNPKTHSTIRSQVIGGELQANSYITQDALVGANYQLLGNPFGSSTPTAARFVDISPWQNTFTALYFDKLVLGDATCGLTLNRQYRMLDRFLNFQWAGDLRGLVYVTTTWQTCFAKEHLEWVVGNSALLKNLQQQMQQQGAQGLMFRFSTYLTCYDRNGVFNDFPAINTHSTEPADLAQVQLMYQKGLDNVADIFFNPAYSRTAATLGLWFADEYPTAPAGRRLVPANPVSIFKTNDPKDAKKTTLGVTSAQISGNILSLDLANTFPFYPVDPKAAILTAEKFRAGDYQLGVRLNDRFNPVVSFGFEQYHQAAFDKRSGLLDFTLSDAQKATLQSGPLELQQQAPLGSPTVAASQQTWTAEVIESGSFIDVGDHKTLNIMVQKNGQPAAGAVLWVAEYGNPYMVTTSDYYLAFSNPADFTLFYDNLPDRTQNQANLPYFVDMVATSNVRATGSGRGLTALHTEQAPDAAPLGVPVGYQQFLHELGKPIAINLRPCLALDAAIQQTGTLHGNNSKVNYSVAKITTDAKGIAQLGFRAQAPGFPTLRFFVQEDDATAHIPFSFSYPKAQVDFLAPIRVLPLDPALQQAFIDYWNSIYTRQNASTLLWENFIYPRILQSFYYLYPIMNKFMPLNSQARVEGAVDQLIVLVSKEYQEESTLAMPITRDMSQSRRAVLELWANALVKRNYPPIQLSMSDFNNR